MKQEKQFSAVFLGSSLQFSDQFIRVLSFEFPEVRFEREHDAQAAQLDPQPRLLVFHESLHNLEEAILDIREKCPDATVAVACAEASDLRDVLSPELARTISLLPLHTPIDVWLSILRLLLCGHTYIPAENVCDRRHRTARRSEPPAGKRNDTSVCLTPREMQILPLIADGLQNKVIAGTLGLSEHTVKLHSHNIFAKLGVSNRTAAATWYLSQVEKDARPEKFHDD